MKRAYSVNDIHVVLNEIFLSHGLVADKWNALLICVKDNTTHNTFVSYLQSHLRNTPVDMNKVELCLDVVDFIIDCSFDCKLITVISSDEVMSYVVAVAQSKCVNKTFKTKIAYLINKWLRIFNLNKSHPAFKGFLNAYVQLKYAVGLSFPNTGEHVYIPTYKRLLFPLKSFEEFQMNIISKKNALSSCTDNVSDVKNEIKQIENVIELCMNSDLHCKTKAPQVSKVVNHLMSIRKRISVLLKEHISNKGIHSHLLQLQYAIEYILNKYNSTTY